jgi:hypothetical protein
MVGALFCYVTNPLPVSGAQVPDSYLDAVATDGRRPERVYPQELIDLPEARPLRKVRVL